MTISSYALKQFTFTCEIILLINTLQFVMFVAIKITSTAYIHNP